jgi:hypothetical protein
MCFTGTFISTDNSTAGMSCYGPTVLSVWVDLISLVPKLLLPVPANRRPNYRGVSLYAAAASGPFIWPTDLNIIFEYLFVGKAIPVISCEGS